MAWINPNAQTTGRRPPPTGGSMETITVRAEVSLALGDLGANSAGTVLFLPAGYVYVSALIDADQLDINGTPSLIASFGVMNAADTDLTTTWNSGLSFGRTAGGSVVAITPTVPLMRDVAVNFDRRIGIKFTAPAATRAAGILGVTLQYRPAS